MSYPPCPRCGQEVGLYEGWGPGVGIFWQVRCAKPERGGCGFGSNCEPQETQGLAETAWRKLVAAERYPTHHVSLWEE